MSGELRDLLRRQDGMVSRRQLLGLGLTPARIRSQVRAGRWRVVHRGVFATFTGPVPPRASLWAAVLACGEGAVVAGRSALWLAGLRSAFPVPGPVEVEIPTRRRITAPRGTRMSRRDSAVLRRSVGSPPRLPVELAVCDVADREPTAAGMVDVVLAVLQQRLTTTERLRAELAARPRHTHRAALLDLLTETRDGVRSPLERRFRSDVVEAHGLPRASYNHRDRDEAGQVRYRDARFRGGRVLVELDGRLGHAATDDAFRDRRRDNRAALSGSVTLRYGWHEIAGDACGIAAELASVLLRDGWRGAPTPCGPECALRPAA